MSNATKLGLPSWAGFVIDYPLRTLIMGLVISPMMMFLIGWVGESRMLPIWTGQFKAFLPGDLFLGVSLAFAARRVGEWDASQVHWYQTSWYHTLVLSLSILIAVVTRAMDSKVYETHSFVSPTKLYHDYGAFVLLAVLLGLLLIPVVVVGRDYTAARVWALAFFVFWLICLIIDMMSDQQAIGRIAHPSNWQPLWRH